MARGQFDLVGVQHFHHLGRHQEIASEKELALLAVEFLGLGVFHKDGAHQGDARARGLFHAPVDVGHQLIAQLDVAAADGFVLGPVHPGLLIGGAFRRMVAVNGVERAQFNPPRQQVGGRTAVVPTDIVSYESVTGNAQAEQIRHTQAKVIPGAGVVTCPRCGVALRPSVGGPSQHKRPLIRPELQQSFVSGTHVLHAVDVMNGAVIQGDPSVEAVPRIERHSLVRALEDRRLVHVVPEPANSHAGEVLVKSAPPFARLLSGELREDTLAGPDDSHVE